LFSGDAARYLNLACSAIKESSVAEVPRGRYIPVSHSLIVCWRVPSFSESPCCVSPKCRRRDWILSPSHRFLITVCLFFTP
jgi:hypothetical protein